ncbi:MAG TPA: PQQ-binding-like beta-propeller repeat protein, partial [Caldimonas sp.]|nr:PQQ-binding-like beta-propeller repeat protein [Caldimonas sp.]
SSDHPARVEARAPRMLHEDAHRTHRAHGRAPTRPNLAWTYATGGPIEAQITTSPDEQTLYVSSLDGSVTALSRTGEKRWIATFGDRVYSTPCVADDGSIYVGTDAKKFVALTSDGRVRWRLDTDGDADTGAALTKEGNVVFAAGQDVYAVRSGGDLLWKFRAKRKVFTAPAIADDGMVVFGSQDDHVYAVTARGALAWVVDLGADVDGGPAMDDDGAVYVGTDAGELVKLDPRGQIVWRAKLGGYVRGSISIARNGDVLAGVYGPAPREVRVAGDDGSERGALNVLGTGARDFGVQGGALEDDVGTLVFGTQDDALYVMGPDGAVRWRYVTGGDVDSPATVLSDGTLLVGSDDGKVYCFAP